MDGRGPTRLASWLVEMAAAEDVLVDAVLAIAAAKVLSEPNFLTGKVSCLDDPRCQSTRSRQDL